MRVVVLLSEVVKILDLVAYKLGFDVRITTVWRKEVPRALQYASSLHIATTPCSCHVYGRFKIIPIHFVNYYDVIRGFARKNDSQFDHKQCVCESNIEMNHRFL